jgi:hypothetical protein
MLKPKPSKQFDVLVSFAFSHFNNEGMCYFVGSMISVPIYVAIASMLLWGVSNELPNWLLPHIFIQILTISAVILMIMTDTKSIATLTYTIFS